MVDRTKFSRPRSSSSRRRFLGLGGVALALAGCQAVPLEHPGVEASALAAWTSRPVEASAPALGRFRELEREGVRGGELAELVPGSPDDVVRALLDFEAADGHRAWADSFELLEAEPGRVVARWHFRGKLGVEPRAVLEFRVAERGPERIVAFALLEPDFGIARFFGELVVLPSPERLEATGVPQEVPASVLVQRVFIASGLPFVGASSDDIERGLRDDAERLAAWMSARLH